MTTVQPFFRWFRYRLIALSKYSIHSPFVFSLITEVLEDHCSKAQYKEVEKIRKYWSRLTTIICRYDLGASADKGKEISIGEIVRKHSVRKKYGRLLYRLAKRQQAHSILELGTSVGISTSYLVEACPKAVVTTIEACTETQNTAVHHPILKGNQNVRFMNMPFNEALLVLAAESYRFDLVFIDGDHTKEGTLRYFEQLLKMATNDSLLIFDDIHWSEGMEDAWAEIKANPEVRLTLDLFQFGLVYIKKELSKQDIVLRF